MKKKILITGGTGFLGYHLAKYALKKKFRVFSISKKIPRKKRHLKQVIYLKSDLSKIKEININNSFDYVINCAGYGSHFKNDAEGKRKYLQIINILKNIFNIINKDKLKKFIQIGTSLEYSKSKKKIQENFHCLPNSFYGKAKLECTRFLLLMHKKFNFPVTIFRVFQIYGPLQDNNRLIPYVISRCKKNSKFNLTKGEQIRNFCYIDDFVKAVFISLNKKASNGQVLNIGHLKSYKIKKVVNLIRNLIGKGKPVFGKKKIRLGETKYLVPNLSKIKKVLKWEAKISLIDGIRRTI